LFFSIKKFKGTPGKTIRAVVEFREQGIRHELLDFKLRFKKSLKDARTLTLIRDGQCFLQRLQEKHTCFYFGKDVNFDITVGIQ